MKISSLLSDVPEATPESTAIGVDAEPAPRHCDVAFLLKVDDTIEKLSKKCPAARSSRESAS
jgi:hypothetical protein